MHEGSKVINSDKVIHFLDTVLDVDRNTVYELQYYKVNKTELRSILKKNPGRYKIYYSCYDEYLGPVKVDQVKIKWLHCLKD